MTLNAVQPSTVLTVKGKSYNILFTFAAIADAEAATGQPLISGLTKKDMMTPKMNLVIAMLYAGHHACNPSFTLAEATDLVNFRTWADIWTVLLEAWVACMTRVGADEDADPTKGQS